MSSFVPITLENSNIPSKDWRDLTRYSKEYIAGVESFLDFAYSYGDPQGEEIQCPCAKCCNIRWTRKNVVYDHLICYGFVKGYIRWINHGEWDINLNVDDDMDYSCDDIDGLLNDQFRDVVQAEGVYDGPNEDAKKFYNLVEEASQELYPELLKEAMPELNIPPSYNKTKSMVKNLDLDYEKIDACPNDCMLFKNDHKDDEFCHTCGASGYIKSPKVDSELEPSGKQHRVSTKTLRHFPLIPRLKRLFMCSKTVDSLRWHEEERSKNGKLRHPANGAKKIDPFILDNKSLSQAHAYLLGNCEEVQVYIREHEQEVNNQPRRSKWNKAKNHCQNFSQWFETHALFHVRQCDARRKTQNSGVTLVASTTGFASLKDKNLIAADLTYYGKIVDIVELDYYGNFKVVLFKYDWYEVENDAYGLTYVYFNKRCSQEETFVLGSQTVSRDLFNMGDEVESNLPKSYENEPSEHLMGPYIPKVNGEVLLTRTDVPETIIDVPSKEFVAQQLEVEYEEEFEDEFEDESENKYEDESEEEFEDDAP
ncbi:hypothetical protein KY284_007854 [Solanum tuberosum]|nr:hypothetical protein KY284_007854 [Solanum tuberosum]